jgi:GPI mannosyltransferase 1 subunit X
MPLSSSLSLNDGFHRTSTTHISSSTPSKHCSFHLSFTLPPLIFIDPYELAHHARSYTFRHWGTANLELPVHAVSPTNSVLLLNLTVPQKTTNQLNNWNIEINVPLHLRYGDSSGGNAGNDYDYYYNTEMDWPIGFVACPGDVTGLCESPPRRVS